jgi:hypothetical protein
VTVVIVRAAGRTRVQASLDPASGNLIVRAPLGLRGSAILAGAAGHLDGDHFQALVDVLMPGERVKAVAG